jgi:hypothetical protein
MKPIMRAVLMRLFFIPVLWLVLSTFGTVFYGQPALGLANNADQKTKSSKKPAGRPVIWRDPGAVEEFDFVGGAGGRRHAPKPPFTFIEENLSGSNPKVDVKDANGNKWGVKWGSEVNAEVFATRLAWAAGYFVEPDYFVAHGRIIGVTGLSRAKKYVSSDGSFTDARFEMKKGKGIKKLDGEQSWRWDQNPFVGTRELNGMKIIMMLTSNFDNKDQRDVSRGSNTAILFYPVAGGTEARYLVTDWGGSMGKWGNYFSREKWDCKGFSHQTPDFVKGVKKGFVEWGFSGQHTKDLTEEISVNDVKWLLRYVGRITDGQLRAGLRASGATPEEVACFTGAIRDRINQMRGL